MATSSEVPMGLGSKSKKSKGKKSKKKRTSAPSRFELMQDFRQGDAVPPMPVQFAFEFKLMRRILRWVKKRGVLRDGILSMYKGHIDMEKNKVWRQIDLAQSVVSYRTSDQRIVINTLDESPDIYRLKLDDEPFKHCVRALRQHRLFRQSASLPKSSLVIKEASVKEKKPSPPPVEESAPPPSTLDAALEKLEQICKADSKDKPEEFIKAQQDYLALARDVTKRIQAMNQARAQPKSVKKSSSMHRPSQSPSENERQQPKLVPQKPAVPRQSSQKETPKTSTGPSPKPVVPMLNKPTTIERDTSKTSVAASLNQSASSQPKINIAKTTSTIPAVKSPNQTPDSPAPAPKTTELNVPPPRLKSPEARPPTPPEIEPAKPKPSPPRDDDEASDDEHDHKKRECDAEDSGDPSDEAPNTVKFPSFRQALPAPMGPAPSLFRLLLSAVGRDINHLPLPTAAMEPLSMLQVLCEELEYSHLIHNAIECKKAKDRMAFVAALAVSSYGQTVFRVGRKPFSPLLGETFEYASPQGWKYVSEQVSHHPAVSACFVEGHGWRFWQDRQFLITWGGSSVEARVIGVVNLHLNKWNETYRWNKVTSTISGVLTGKQTIDHHGELSIKCEQSKMSAKLNFKRMSGSNRGEVSGKILKADDRIVEKLNGKWTESLSAERGGVLWRIGEMPADPSKYYGFSRFALSLNETKPSVHGVLPSTDCRQRPDINALEMGQTKEADKIKADLENKQRQRNQKAEPGHVHKPMWFKATGNEDGSCGQHEKTTPNIERHETRETKKDTNTHTHTRYRESP